MADDRMAVLDTVRKAINDGDVDCLREGVRVLAQAVMEAECAGAVLEYQSGKVKVHAVEQDRSYRATFGGYLYGVRLVTYRESEELTINKQTGHKQYRYTREPVPAYRREWRFYTEGVADSCLKYLYFDSYGRDRQPGCDLTKSWRERRYSETQVVTNRRGAMWPKFGDALLGKYFDVQGAPSW